MSRSTVSNLALFPRSPLKKIGLAKLFLWSEAERIQTYPEAFAKLDSSRLYTKRKLAMEVFGLLYRELTPRKPIRGDLITNCFGLDSVSEEKVVIRGINCLHQVDSDHFQATDDALAIGRGYKEGKEDEWVIPLARQIARYEVRTRLLLYLLGREEWCLTFPTPDFFALPSVKARLIRGDESLTLFANQGVEFNRLLQEYRRVALGRWWEAELQQAGYEIELDFQFEGIRDRLPSTNKLNSNIKSSLFLMKYLGVLESRNGGWKVCSEKVVEVLGETIASDFIETRAVHQENALLHILKSLAQEMQDSEGFVIVSHLAKSWASRTSVPLQKAEIAFDLFMREQIYEGTIRVVARHQGQPRHGRGLFGDHGSRKIKLEF